MWHIDFSPEQNYLDHQTGKKTHSHIETEPGVCKSWNPKKERDCRLMEMTVGKQNKRNKQKSHLSKFQLRVHKQENKQKPLFPHSWTNYDYGGFNFYFQCSPQKKKMTNERMRLLFPLKNNSASQDETHWEIQNIISCFPPHDRR